MSVFDRWVLQLDTALKTLNNVGTPSVQSPELETRTVELTEAEKQLSAALMRVNHVGEVCAQALYAGQSLTARTSQLKAFNQHSAEQEKDHLLWTHQRLKALNGRPSALNPVWYLGSWALGCAAGLMGDRVSLSFVKETENQVEAHLSSHLDRLPINDLASRAIVAKMAVDEAAHADQAVQLGGAPLPTSAVQLMRTSAKVMTTVAHYV
jgi:ubiquinone biosynthesis monooxygenase Coq7